MSRVRHMWIGTGPGDAGGPVGVWRVDRGPSGSWDEVPPRLVVEAPAPTFLAVHPAADRLYAVGERAPGTVSSYDVDSSCVLRRTGEVSSGGAGPCHLLVHPQGRWLYVANYGDGTVGAIELTEAGDVSTHVIALSHAGSGPVADRQEGPHAHSSLISPDGDFLVVADLGTDELRAYPIDGGRPDPEPVITALPPGTGPRHVATNGDYLYVAGELSGEVVVVAWLAGEGRGEVVQRVAAATLPGRSQDVHQLSHILAHGDRVLVGVRGADSISTLRIDGDGDRLTLVGEVETATWPRHLEVVDGEVVVAGEREDTLAVHPLADGTVGPASLRVTLPVPMCVVPM